MHWSWLIMHDQTHKLYIYTYVFDIIWLYICRLLFINYIAVIEWSASPPSNPMPRCGVRYPLVWEERLILFQGHEGLCHCQCVVYCKRRMNCCPCVGVGDWSTMFDIHIFLCLFVPLFIHTYIKLLAITCATHCNAQYTHNSTVCTYLYVSH